MRHWSLATCTGPTLGWGHNKFVKLQLHNRKVENRPKRSSLPAVKVSGVGVLFSFSGAVTLAGILLKVFLTVVGDALGLGHGLPEGDWVGVVPFL